MSELIEALPAMIAAAKTGRLSVSAAITVDFAALREAAYKVGYHKQFTGRALQKALVELGAHRAPNSHTGAKYFFPGCLRMEEVLRLVESNRQGAK
ncbi:hypothetical protein [Burkholderia sp. WSM2230]|uniref:hypothetical protein n=1 Tax=Burkholderia sp. WSM2230 TaxID=944435 RepID=UPI00046FAFAE|nr:hypothetical protein [Burkholderia sp. WSM2230]